MCEVKGKDHLRIERGQACCLLVRHKVLPLLSRAPWSASGARAANRCGSPGWTQSATGARLSCVSFSFPFIFGCHFACPGASQLWAVGKAAVGAPRRTDGGLPQVSYQLHNARSWPSDLPHPQAGIETSVKTKWGIRHVIGSGGEGL